MASNVRPMFASVCSRLKHSARRSSPSVFTTSASSRSTSRNGRRCSHVAIALRCTARYASSRPMPASTSASSTGLREHEPVRRVQVLDHALRVHVHALDDRAELHQHVVGELQRVGHDHALHRRVRDVALVPQRDVFHAGGEVAAQHAGETAELLALHRVALVGHRARALLRPGPERLLDLAHLGALQVTDLERERLDRGPHRRARVEHLGVTVAGEHLRGGHRLQAERPAHVGLDRGVDVGVGADRARQLADGDRGPGPGEALPVAAHLQGPQGELHAERGGLGVDAVGAAGHGRVAPGVGLGGDGALQRLGGVDHEVERPGRGSPTGRCRRRRWR